MRRFPSADAAVRWWIDVRTNVQIGVRGSDVFERIRGRWAERCSNPRCDSTRHSAAYSKKHLASVEKCAKCGSEWKTVKNSAAAVQVSRRGGGGQESDLLVAGAIGYVMARLRADLRSIYVEVLEKGVRACSEDLGLAPYAIRRDVDLARAQVEFMLREEGLLRGGPWGDT